MQIGNAPKNINVAAKPVQVEGATISQKDGTLTIQAGDKGTNVKVSEDYRGLHVQVGDKELHFKQGEYPKGIEIKGGAGDDRIKVASGIKVPIKVDGGAGDDKIENFNAGTTIHGGAGKDKVENYGRGAKITVGDDAEVSNVRGDGARIEAGKNAKILNDSDDAFVRVGKGADVFYTGYRNVFEFQGMWKNLQGVGKDNAFEYPFENRGPIKG